ncbi:Copper homeostasis domain [Cordyceps militaris]|uniref:Copper homeostasis protein cutC homolog n=1 Tax=Cordyceps militaris TaxID=73501 RepID=A0A2H4S5M6_CORMI|nr:Copper homeostasis domain [Cordyceps militaris]
MAPLPLEVAVFSAADALTAQSLGAARIELNAAASYPCGGLTPSLSSLSQLSSLRVPVRVMIRPRGPPPTTTADFIYTAAEVAAMRAAIAALKPALNPARGDGFVFGALTPTAAVDADTCRELVACARPLLCVFHRAFDALPDVEAGVDALVRCGFAGVLTAGGPVGGGCAANAERLAQVVACCAAGRLEVVAGGGVRHHNVGALAARFAPGAGVWVHSAALRADGTGLDEEELRKLLAALAA